MRRILIVDDSWFQRMNIRELLADDNLKLMEAGTGEDALRLINETSFDCMLLDLMMPGMDGFEVLEEMGKMVNVPPVIVISADVQNTTRERCLSLGARQLINKPLTPATGLPEIIRKVLDGAS